MATYMAYFELHPPGRADDLRAARLAFYAANRFRKPVQFNSLKREFLPRSEPVTTSKDVAKLFGEVSDMPEHVAKRFH